MYNVPTEKHGPIGIDTLDEIFRLAIKTQVVTQKGGWYHHPYLPEDSKGEHKVQGLVGFQRLLKDDEVMRERLTGEVMASLKDHGGEVAPLSDPEAPVDIELVPDE